MSDIKRKVLEVASPAIVEQRRVRLRHPYSEYLDLIDCQYHGETVNGLPHGMGHIDYNSHEADNWQSFKGYASFQEGRMNGRAILFCGFKNTRVFDASLGIREGKGYSVGGNDEYNGEYRQKVAHGYGRNVSKSGQVFEGLWEEGLMKEGVLLEPGKAPIKQVFDVNRDRIELKSRRTQVPKF